jgi:hypothetical protein
MSDKEEWQEAYTLPANERAVWGCLDGAAGAGRIIGDVNCGWRRVLGVLEGWCVSWCAGGCGGRGRLGWMW